MIEWTTERPARFAEVLVDTGNFSQVVARTDGEGRFRFQPRNSPAVYFLHTGLPSYGRLLSTTFGQTVALQRRGQEARDIVVPAIPATVVSGHVRGSNGEALKGCDVSALTRTGRFYGQLDAGSSSVRSWAPFGLTENDERNRWMFVEHERTDEQGRFTFRGLGANRFFLMARCDETRPAAKGKAAFMWAPAIYPDANTIAEAKPVVLQPGERRADVNFYLQRRKAFRLQGRIFLEDGSIPGRLLSSSQDLTVVRSDLGLTLLSPEPCSLAIEGGRFECDPLLPGEYTVWYGIWREEVGRKYRTETAVARYRVGDEWTQPVVLRTRRMDDQGLLTKLPYAGPTGCIDMKNILDLASHHHPVTGVRAWELTNFHYTSSHLSYFFWEPSELRLPPGDYVVSGFEAAFYLHRGRGGRLGDSSTLEELLMQQGTRVRVTRGEKIAPRVRVLTTGELVDLALRSLRGQ